MCGLIVDRINGGRLPVWVGVSRAGCRVGCRVGSRMGGVDGDGGGVGGVGSGRAPAGGA